VKGFGTVGMYQRMIVLSNWPILISVIATMVINGFHFENSWLLLTCNYAIGVACSSFLVLATSIIQFTSERNKVLKEQIDKVLQDTDFQKYNADQHNRFSAALKKYLEYRTGVILQNHTQKTVATKVAVRYPYLEQVTAVLKEHYQYGFRSESVIDMKRFRRYAEDGFF
jgi:hypothetical protein